MISSGIISAKLNKVARRTSLILGLLLYLSITVSVAFGQATKIDSLRSQFDHPMDDSSKVVALNNFALVLYSGDEAVARATEALLISRTLRNSKLMASSYATLAWVHSFKDMEIKIRFLDSAITIFVNLNDKEGLGTVYNTRASIQIEYGDNEGAIVSLRRAYDFFDELGNEHRTAIILNNWAVVLNSLELPNQALEKAEEALAFRQQEDPSNILELGRIHFVMGSTMMKLGKPLQAADHFLDSYQYRNEAGSYGIAEALLELSVLMMSEAQEGHDTLALHQRIRAAGFMNSAALIDSANAVPALEERQRFIYKILDVKRQRALVYGNYKEAYQLLEEQKIYNEERKLSEESLAAFAGLQSKFKQEQLRTDLLEEELLLRQRNSQVKFLLFFIGLMILMLVIGILVHQNRLRRKQIQLNKITHQQQFISMRATLDGQEKERARIARDLHDGLGNLLSTVKVTVSTLKVETSNGQATKFNQANQLIDEACSEIRKISHEMMPQALERLGLTKALGDLVQKLDNIHGFSAGFHVFGTERRLDDHTRLMLFRIVQELLNNVIKYAQASKVTVQLTFGQDWLNLTVEDDGVGFDKQEVMKDNGMGLKSIAFRAADIGASYQLESKIGEGSLVSIDLPLSNEPKTEKL